MTTKSVSHYFKRFASPDALLSEPLDPLCSMIIVIPCFNEPDIIGTLNSLVQCSGLISAVEVIVVVNQSEIAGNEIKDRNQKTIHQFHHWNKEYESSMIEVKEVSTLKFHLLESLDQPLKTAGVGLARKTGMDEALRRFASINKNGTIICLDADCRVSKGYLSAIQQQFVNSNAGIGEMRFEHRFEQEASADLRKGIVNYELFLRYYVEGLRQSRFPNAIHTIGSCMLVKSETYAKHGGMNKRKAGEDFYFLHKIIPHEKFITVNNGIVYPSCRTSDRVPFGTGKAQQDWLDQERDEYLTYDPKIFYDLEKMNASIHVLFEMEFDQWIQDLPESMLSFFGTHHYKEKVELIKSNCKTLTQFKKQFYVWFDGFLCLKFVHFARDQYYANIPLLVAAKKLIDIEGSDLISLLKAYRVLDQTR